MCDGYPTVTAFGRDFRRPLRNGNPGSSVLPACRMVTAVLRQCLSRSVTRSRSETVAALSAAPGSIMVKPVRTPRDVYGGSAGRGARGISPSPPEFLERLQPRESTTLRLHARRSRLDSEAA